MPESRGRDRKAAPYIPPKSSKATEPNPTWWAPVFITLLVVGLLWIVVYYIAGAELPVMKTLGWWNIIVGFGLIGVGFGMSTRWR